MRFDVVGDLRPRVGDFSRRMIDFCVFRGDLVGVWGDNMISWAIWVFDVVQLLKSDLLYYEKFCKLSLTT